MLIIAFIGVVFAAHLHFWRVLNENFLTQVATRLAPHNN